MNTPLIRCWVVASAFLMCHGVVISPSVSWGQETTTTAALKTLNATVNKLAKQVDGLSKAVVRRDDLDAAIVAITGNAAAIEKLKSDHAQVVQTLYEQIAEQKQILDAISRQDSGGRRILALQSIMQSDEFRKELGEAVAATVKKGQLLVHNRMATDLLLKVNGTTYRIPAATENFAITVPVGNLSTELIGYEAPKHWTIAAPNFTQVIEIKPSPVVIVGPPVYFFR